ncbi:nuclease-related domain-containing protein [Evansella tamaricis]|uniref:NERD domain-containing protein n=1 Tax=Evansella tamaricis TaxID=2069301 RepID=A0ABS6JAM8_9BACI|nr:nuclease-related domain-containing protein [Evansella tamaricis]MBU9710744.1 NERD domain-containing protein [Evansella tamaricis]
MIIKARQKSVKLLKLEALLRRLPQNHSKREKVEKEYRITKAGFKGEQSIDYYLNFIPHELVLIFHDLKLSNQKVKFQMDTLILTPYFILIAEIKYLAGEVTYDPDMNQLIQTYNGSKKIYGDPIHQVERQAYQIKQWLNSQKLLQNAANIPIESVVVFANDQAQFTILPSQLQERKYILQKFFRSSKLPDTINNFITLHSTPYFSNKDLKKMTKLLLKHNINEEIDVLQLFQINQAELVQGVFCPECNTIPMVRKHGAWLCINSYCRHRSKQAHYIALEDYKLLLGDRITNKKMLNFLSLTKSSSCKYLLKTMHLPYEGSTKNRVYCLASSPKKLTRNRASLEKIEREQRRINFPY